MTRAAGSPAAKLATQLAADIGERAAVAWVHAPAMVQHAIQTGLMPPLLHARGDPVNVIRAAVGYLASAHPALTALADPGVNPLWETSPGPEHAAQVTGLWRHANLTPLRERTDGYLIGDLYQELSPEARARRALCQTPRFVTELLLDISYDRAAQEWGHRNLRLIDPACGTGHILMEAFIRACATRPRTARSADGTPAGQVEAALGLVHGVDIDPYAVTIARYRLLAAACRWAGQRLQLRDLPRDLPVQVTAADSLLADAEPLLERGSYHVVVANPPYITCKDPAQREKIRSRYKDVCSGVYSLAVPFEVLMHQLCVPGGWVARLTANSFMKREFGKKLIERYFPQIDLQWIIDTSGAYIPGHGTPTVILVSRAQPPSTPTVRTVLGVRGEPSRPADPARGIVWNAIASRVREREALDQLDRAAAAATQTVGAPVRLTLVPDTPAGIRRSHRQARGRPGGRSIQPGVPRHSTAGGAAKVSGVEATAETGC